MKRKKIRGRKVAVLALGGNAIIRPGEKGSIHEQFANTRNSLQSVVGLIEEGWSLIITHGNGPQVGNSLLRSELAAGKVPDLPLGVLVADTEGGMGYMIQQSLQNILWKRKIRKPVVTLVTQVIVDKHDPRLREPSKPIGPFFSEADARRLMDEKHWVMKEDSGRGWRRLVPSPRPLKIVEHRTIELLVKQGIIVIAAGGGGVPVVLEDNGDFEGVDVVVDKDLATALLATEAGADLLIITTGVDKVSIHYGKPEQRTLSEITAREAEKYLQEGHFPPGSMGPKIEAAVKFLRAGGKRVIITSPEKAVDAVHGRDGTHIVMSRKRIL